MPNVSFLLSGHYWSDTNITYSFPTRLSTWVDYDSNSEPYAGFAPVTSNQQQGIRQALNAWASVANLHFSYVSEPTAVGQLRFAQSSKPPTAWGYYPSASYATGGDVWFGTKYNYKNPLAGNYAYSTCLHEIGHALGLKHPHQNGDIASLNDDCMELSVMSYKSYAGSSASTFTNSSTSYAQSLMLYDIAAIQQIYGVNYNYHSGNDVYKFSPSKPKIFETIWDGGGIDTYDLSSYYTGVRVNIKPGQWSTFSASQLAVLDRSSSRLARGNIATAYLPDDENALSALIENIIGGSGSDVLTGNQTANQLVGGAGADIIYGAEENDTLLGGIGADVLYGDTGDDLLNGGADADALYGGADSDTYIIDNASDRVIEYNNDGIDIICTSVSYTISNNIEALSLTGTGRINGAGNNLNNNLTGNINHNILTGLGGNDILLGLSGNDTLNGSDGYDTLYGGIGNDVYIVNNDIFDTFIEIPNEGFDTICASLDYTLTEENIEALILTGKSKINGTGSDYSDILLGNSNDNVLSGMNGNDTLDGVMGSDTIFGDDGNDIIFYDSADILVDGGSGIDTIYATKWAKALPMLDLRNDTVFKNFENFIGGTQNSEIIGTDAANLLDAGAGTDVLYGLDGSDTLYGRTGVDLLFGGTDNDYLDGGIGVDILTGGSGNDTYVVDSLADSIIEDSTSDNDTILSSINYSLNNIKTAFIENLILTGSSNLNGTGSKLNNILIGNAGANYLSGLIGNDALGGNAGKDTLDGGLGNDTLSGGTGNDMYCFSTGFGNDIITEFEHNDMLKFAKGIHANDMSYDWQGNDLIVSIDTNHINLNNFTGDFIAFQYDTTRVNTVIMHSGNNAFNFSTTVTALSIIGQAGDDSFIGSKGADTIYGSFGNDTLDGSSGSDLIDGGSGNDYIAFDSTDKLICGGLGWDTLYIPVLIGKSINLGLFGDIESVVGNNGNDTLVGNALDNVLTSGAGNDRLNGGAGSDTLIGGIGTDSYYFDGSFGNDIVTLDSTDTIYFNKSILASDATWMHSGNNLVMNYHSDSVIFYNWLLYQNTIYFGTTPQVFT